MLGTPARLLTEKRTSLREPRVGPRVLVQVDRGADAERHQRDHHQEHQRARCRRSPGRCRPRSCPARGAAVRNSQRHRAPAEPHDVAEDHRHHQHDQQRGERRTAPVNAAPGASRRAATARRAARARGASAARAHAPRSRRRRRSTNSPAQHVDHERDREQERAEEEQHRVVRAADHDLGQLGGDASPTACAPSRTRLPRRSPRCPRPSARSWSRRPRAPGRAGCRPTTPADGRRQRHAPRGLPRRRAERERGLAVGARHRAQRVLAHREDDRDDRRARARARR